MAVAHPHHMFNAGAIAQLAERLVYDRKVATPGSIPELAIRCCVLGKDTLRLFLLGPNSVPLWWPSATKNLHTGPRKGYFALVWLNRRRVPELCAGINEQCTRQGFEPVFSSCLHGTVLGMSN